MTDDEIAAIITHAEAMREAMSYYVRGNDLGCECSRVVDCGQCAVCRIKAALALNPAASLSAHDSEVRRGVWKNIVAWADDHAERAMQTCATAREHGMMEQARERENAFHAYKIVAQEFSRRAEEGK